MALYDPQDKHTFRHDLTPYENEALSIGRSGRRFSIGYFRDLIADTLTLLTFTVGSLTVTTRATVPDPPVNPTDAATKAYVDGHAAGIVLQESDGVPSLSAVTTVNVDQATGLQVSGASPNGTIAINQVPISKGGTGASSIVSGYVKSNGTALSGQATPLPAADGGLGAALPASGYLKGGASVTSQAVPIPLADGGTGATALASGYIKSNGSVLSSQATPIPAADLGTGSVGDGSTVLKDNGTWGAASGGTSLGVLGAFVSPVPFR